ncbi:MAG: hypothetical protein U0587_18765 [Candidatus Binatia bacterium]
MPFRQVMQVVEEKTSLNPEDLRKMMVDIVDDFDAYLDAFPGAKVGRSKHAVMGPVARVLDRLRHGRGDVEDTVGYALRVHEGNPHAAGFISPDALGHLKNGTAKLKDLLVAVPAGSIARTVERIDYAVYFRRREKSVAFMHEISQKFASYVNADPERQQMWAGKLPHFPSKSGKWFDKLDEKLKVDIAAFWEQIRNENRAAAEEAEAVGAEEAGGD